MVSGADLVLGVFAVICRRQRGRRRVRGGRTHGTAQVWGEWASARMLRVLVREGARVHAAAGVRTVAPPVFLVQCVPGPKSAVAGAPAFFGPIPRVTTPGESGNCLSNVLYLFLGQVPKADIARRWK